MEPRPPLILAVSIETWPIAGSFAISLGAKTQVSVVVAELSDGHHLLEQKAAGWPLKLWQVAEADFDAGVLQPS